MSNNEYNQINEHLDSIIDAGSFMPLDKSKVIIIPGEDKSTFTTQHRKTGKITNCKIGKFNLPKPTPKNIHN